MAVSLDEAWYGLDKGWHAVYLPSMYYDYDEIVAWLTENVAGQVRFHAAVFLFQDSRDATIFMFNKATWNYLKND